MAKDEKPTKGAPPKKSDSKASGKGKNPFSKHQVSEDTERDMMGRPQKFGAAMDDPEPDADDMAAPPDAHVDPTAAPGGMPVGPPPPDALPADPMGADPGPNAMGAQDPTMNDPVQSQLSQMQTQMSAMMACVTSIERKLGISDSQDGPDQSSPTHDDVDDGDEYSGAY